MPVYSFTSYASSLNPSDWGRAFATAIEGLIAEAGSSSDVFGQELTVRVEKKDDGADITLSWTPLAAPGAPKTDDVAGTNI
ncbi:MAG: hypothetical protein JWR01_2951 [Subtercola sp.]|nr:hypothetical protein [Subtercola sp.]